MNTIEPLISVDRDACRECWRCARHCPARAISVIDGMNDVIQDKCVACGLCVNECSNGGHVIRDDGPSVDSLLASGRPVVAVLATEFVAALYPRSPEEIEADLESIGFYGVESTILGEEAVALEYEARHSLRNGRPVIRSTCPVVNDWIRKYHPAFVGALASVVPPYVAQARLIKAIYPEDTAVVYVSPCYARKDEAIDEHFGGAVDVAIDFTELVKALDRLDSGERRAGDDSPGDRRPEPLKELSLTDGYPRSILAPVESHPADVRVVRGLAELERLLCAIAAGETAPLVIDALNCEGCIDGPAVAPRMSLCAKRNLESTERKRRVHSSISSREVLRHLPAVELRRCFTPAPVIRPRLTDEKLLEILEEGGFADQSDLLDCGACGHSRCVEHAYAIFRGESSWEMCFPQERKKLEKQVRSLQSSGTLDPLTGLWNRRIFSERLHDEFSRHIRYGGPLSLVLIDVDGCGALNEIHGRPSVDAAFAVIADLLRTSLRSTDMPARYGGDEFAILLPGTGKTEAFAVAEKLREAVSALRPESLSQRGVEKPVVTVSIGVAAANAGAGEAMELLDAADRALHQAKGGGSDQVRLG